MVGIGVPEMNTRKYLTMFSSALGEDNMSWGLSYRGNIIYNGRLTHVSNGAFKRGDIISCFLDMWHGTLTFFINRKPINHKPLS